MTTPPAVVTTSWDDGHILDTRLAALLAAYRIPATFYLAPRNVEIEPGQRLSPAAVRDLATEFEIGGHTLHHLPLTSLDDAAAFEEMRTGRDVLEQLTGTAVTSFCYPLGAYRPVHVRLARKAGFRIARTVRRARLSPGPLLELATTVNAYRHLVDGPQAARLTGFRPGAALKCFRHWDELAIRWFDRCLREGGVFHLWGHSWEVAARGDWHRLEKVLAYVAGRPGVRYVTNGALTGLTGLTGLRGARA